MLILKNLIKISPILFLVAWLYLPLTRSFFQQDEWLAFGRHFLLLNSGFWELIQNAFWNTGAHYAPLSFLAINSLFRVFVLDFRSYAIFSIFLHLINVYLVFVLAGRFNKDRLFPYFSALLFGVMAAGSQSTSWVVADTSVHLSFAFALSSLIFFHKFTQGKLLKDFIYSLLFLIISLFFKEIAIGLFAFYFLVMLYLKFEKKYLYLLTFAATLFILIRVVLFLQPGPEVYSQSASRAPDIHKKALITNLVFSPINALAQTIIPSTSLVAVSKTLTAYLPDDIAGQKMTAERDTFILQRTIPALSISIFIILIFTLIKLNFSRHKSLYSGILLSTLFVFLNSFVFSYTPERREVVFLLDSRNLYFISLGTVFLIIFCLKLLSGKSESRFYLLLASVIILNIFVLRQDLNSIVTQGSERQDILNKVVSEYPNLGKKTIFYTESDHSFYGLPENARTLPFQSGLGQTLVIWYYPTNPLPKKFLQNKYLWGIEEQGYLESESRGFGFIRDFNLLAKTIQENNLPLDSIIAYRYSYNDKKIINNTEEIKGRAEGYFSSKVKIDQKNWKISFESEPEEGSIAGLDLLKDGKRETFWGSPNPYNDSQSLTIELPKVAKIAQISLDTYNNKDQNNVGYKVMLSENGQEWETVFYSQKYPPDQQGKTDIYIKPLPAKYIRLEQSGYHQYAPWIIHEIELYESLEK